LNKDEINQVIPNKISKNIVNLFKRLLKNSGTKMYLARELYGWKPLEYWFYYYLPEVQNYLLFKHDRRRGPVKKVKAKNIWTQKVSREIKIRNSNSETLTLESIADALECTRTVITRYKLSKKITKARFNNDLGKKSIILI
jgi:hypothetical protein